MLTLDSETVTQYTEEPIRSIYDIWIKNKLLFELWDIDVQLQSKQKPTCEKCSTPQKITSMSVAEHYTFNRVYDIVEKQQNKRVAIVQGKTRRYKCPKAYPKKGTPKTCTNTHKPIDRAYDIYKNSDLMTKDFKTFVADIALADHLWEYPKLKVLFEHNNESFDEELIKSAVMDRVEQLGKHVNLIAACDTAYIVPTSFLERVNTRKEKLQKKKIFLVFGRVASPESYCPIVSNRMAEQRCDNFALCGIFRNTSAGRSTMIKQLSLDPELNTVIICSKAQNAEPLTNLIRTHMDSKIRIHITGNHLIYNEKVTRFIESRYCKLIEAIMLLVDEMNRRQLSFDELRIRLLRQSRFRRFSHDEEMSDYLQSELDFLFAIKRMTQNPYKAMDDFSFIDRAETYRNSPIVATCLYGVPDSHVYDCHFDVPDDTKPTIATSFVSARMLLSEYINDTLFCDHFDDDLAETHLSEDVFLEEE